MDRNKTAYSPKRNAKEKLLTILGKSIKSKDGTEARISSNSIGKMLHGLDNTLRNGYTAEQHYAAVLIIEELFSKALTLLTHKSNKRGDNSNIIRLAAPF
ncbi:MAG: hypothetical protein FWE23_00040 [Chitinivibrionia bacterium]|nr:hypothetical protein [Chitinivibrionia bacterium]